MAVEPLEQSVRGRFAGELERLEGDTVRFANAFQDQRRRRVSAALACGRFVHRVRREVGRSDNRGVDLSRLKRPHGQLQRAQAGGLFLHHGKALGAPVAAYINAVGRDIRHRAQHVAGLERRGDAIARGIRLRRLRVEAEPFGNSRAQHPAGRFRRAGKAGEHADASAVFQRMAGEGFVDGVIERKLLALCRAKLRRRCAQRLWTSGHLGHRPARLLRWTREALQHRRHTPVRPHAEAGGADHGFGLCGLALAGLRARAVIGGEDQVGIVAAKAEIADGCDAWAILGPGNLLRWHHGRAGKPVQRFAIEPRWRDDALIDRKAHLDQAGQAGGRDEVAEIAFQRADGQAFDTCKMLRRRHQLDLVARRRAGRVRLDESDVVGGIEAGHGPGSGHRFGLPAFVGGEQGFAAAIIGEADAANDAVDGLANRAVGQPFQDDSGGPFRRDEAIGALDEGPRAPARAERIQRRETLVKDEIVGPVHGCCHRDIERAILQPVAGEFHRIE